MLIQTKVLHQIRIAPIEFPDERIQDIVDELRQHKHRDEEGGELRRQGEGREPQPARSVLLPDQPVPEELLAQDLLPQGAILCNQVAQSLDILYWP